MGLFDFGKKKKEREQQEQMRAQLKQKYRVMNLKQLISAVENLRQIFSADEAYEIRASYILALLKADSSEGGFGISSNRLADEFGLYVYGSIDELVKNDGVAYHYDKNGNIVSINRALVFLGNYMRADQKADLRRAWLVTKNVFELQKDESVITFTDEDIMNEHHQIYNGWLGEPSADPKGDDGFRRYKVQVALMLCTPSVCERYGVFKRKNGVVTSEYATVDDLTGVKMTAQLQQLLNSLQTR